MLADSASLSLATNTRVAYTDSSRRYQVRNDSPSSCCSCVTHWALRDFGGMCAALGAGKREYMQRTLHCSFIAVTRTAFACFITTAERVLAVVIFTAKRLPLAPNRRIGLAREGYGDATLWLGCCCPAVHAILVGCGPRAPNRALQISVAIQGESVIGFALPQTGQVVLTVGTQRCDGVLSDFKRGATHRAVGLRSVR